MDKACQSCGMPLEHEDQYGTDAQHHKTDEYCKYCYKEGEFVQPELTMEGMIQQSVPFLVEKGMQEEEATSMLRNYLPFLKRWRSSEDTGLTLDGPIREEYRGEIRLIGLKARTSNQNEQTSHGIIPNMWEHFWSEDVPGRIKEKAGHASVYGCYTDYENGALGEYTFLSGRKWLLISRLLTILKNLSFRLHAMLFSGNSGTFFCLPCMADDLGVGQPWDKGSGHTQVILKCMAVQMNLF